MKKKEQYRVSRTEPVEVPLKRVARPKLLKCKHGHTYVACNGVIQTECKRKRCQP